MLLGDFRCIEGKHEIMGIISRVAFYPTLLYNVVMEQVSSRTWFTHINDTVILGALPFRSMTDHLVEKEKVGGVVSLNEEYELKHFVNNHEEWSKLGVQQLWLSTEDIVAAPTQDNLKRGVNFIKTFENTERKVYVHCKAGRTRSATLVACYFIHKEEMKPEEAVNFICEKRPHISIREPQWHAIREFYKSTRCT